MAARSPSPSRSGWTSSLPSPKPRPPTPLLRSAGRRAQAKPALLLLAERDVCGAFPACADTASPALTLDLERSLRASQAYWRTVRQNRPITLINFGRGRCKAYQWSINNVDWKKDVHASALQSDGGLKSGACVVNQTMMPHPMHLHGPFFPGRGDQRRPIRCAMRDNRAGSSKTTVTIAFSTPIMPGWWSFHCQPFVPSARGYVHNFALQLNARDRRRSTLALARLFTLKAHNA